MRIIFFLVLNGFVGSQEVDGSRPFLAVVARKTSAARGSVKA